MAREELLSYLKTNSRRVVLAAAGAVLAALLLIAFWTVYTYNTPIEHEKAEVFIEIKKGSTRDEIFQKLADEGILNGTWAIWLYTRPQGDALKLKAGEYRFPSPISPREVIGELVKGQERAVRLTIPEGFTRFDIARRIVASFPVEPPLDEKEILGLMDDPSLIADIDPDAKNLEGYLYPTTYSIHISTKPAEIVKMMVDQFRKMWKPEWSARAREIGRTPHEILTIASMVETESKFEAERAIVASVIYNRLKIDMPLGIDQTAVYIAKMEGRWDGTINKSDLRSRSPYNTRRFPGIPPGPIASVSESSIIAALNPAETEYIWYVLDVEKNDGSHRFFVSYPDFEKSKRAYQRWLEEKRRSVKEEAAAPGAPQQ
jgi:UPF0755 protein